MAEIDVVNPAALGKPFAPYSHIARVKAHEFAFIAGQISSDADGNIVGDGNFEAQCLQVFKNIKIALTSVGASWSNIVQFTTYLVDAQDIPKFRDFRARQFPKLFRNGVYPPNSLLIVDRLIFEACRVEVQTVAAL
jgi:enamine deaminase RidA (YjgF/YER057c/UK114 family)